MNIRYLNVGKLYSEEVKKKVLMVTGLVIADFFLFGVVVNIVENNSAAVIMFIVFMFIGLFLFYLGVKVGKKIDMARRYETIFGYDENGIITMGEFSTQLQLPQKKIYRELDAMFRQKYFINCRFETNGQPAVIIFGAQNNTNANNGVGFVICKCRNCGTDNRLRAGSMGRCYACEAPISAVMK